MSRHWSEHKYINAETLWGLMDDLNIRIDLLSEDTIGKGSESYKMFLMGKREAINALCDVLHEEEQTLSEIHGAHNITTVGEE